jgi:protein-S-isoprenylcysteine O-methyltransferase Ste14
MNTIRKIAKPCGIVGAIWSTLFAILLSIITPTSMVTKVITLDAGQFITSETAKIDWGMVITIAIMLLLGVMGLVTMILARRIPRTSRIFIWISSLGTLLLSLALMLILTVPAGLLLLPAAILLILAAVGMKETAPFQGVV